ncbi:hypothetical protein Csa_013881 [Cucumis sativus]|uniref:Uncharacterized protein n=1 Tax=Cucumis sativus TaxID=3659 RepID=A0A0A0LSB0_CUCSA|nr:hypothetical protein Csa_013881 [Cucumis sativus]
MIGNFNPLKEFTFHFLSSLPTSFLSLLLLFLLAYNGLHVFSISPPSPEKTIPHPAPFSPQKRPTADSTSTHLLFSIHENHPPPVLKSNTSVFHHPHLKSRPAKRVGKHKRRLRSLRSELKESDFSARIEEFFAANSLIESYGLYRVYSKTSQIFETQLGLKPWI